MKTHISWMGNRERLLGKTSKGQFASICLEPTSPDRNYPFGYFVNHRLQVLFSKFGEV
jgi:hypothetical protein